MCFSLRICIGRYQQTPIKHTVYIEPATSTSTPNLLIVYTSRFFQTWQKLKRLKSQPLQALSALTICFVCLSFGLGGLAPAALCIDKSRMTQGCPLSVHSFASTITACQHTRVDGIVLIVSSSALTQGVKALTSFIVYSCAGCQVVSSSLTLF